MCQLLVLVTAIPNPLCDIIAATNIQVITGYSQWSCNTAGVTSTTPCNTPVWPGVSCTLSNVVAISVSSIGLTGKIVLE